MSSILQKIGSNLSRAGKNTVKGVENLGNHLTPHVGGVLGQAGNEVATAAKQIAAVPINAVENTVNPILSAVRGVGKGTKNFASQLGIGSTQQATKDAQANMQQAQQAYGDLQPPTLTPEQAQKMQAQNQGPTNLGTVSVNPADRQAQLEQLAALATLSRNGGHNASTDASLAQIQANELANARGQRDAVLQNAQARGVGGSGAALLAQLSGNQAAQTQQNMQDLGVLGQQANTAISAGQAAAGIGQNLYNQDYASQANKAQAQDAIDKFNANQQTGANQYNAASNNAAQQYNTGLQQQGYQNQYQKQSGIANTQQANAQFNQGLAAQRAQQASNIVGGLIKAGTGGIAGYMGPSAVDAGGVRGAISGAANSFDLAKDPNQQNYADGGRIPGHAPYHGDTTLNDIVPIKASPGEVVVPRTLADHGSDAQVADFVKHPHEDREIMLMALANLRKKGEM